MQRFMMLAGVVGVAQGLVCAGTGDVLKLTYPSGAVVTPQSSGANLTIVQVFEAPAVTWSGEGTGVYHYVMVDPDAPTPENPTWADILHQGSINIRGDNFTTGTTLEPYAGPVPPPTSPAHRYCQFLYYTTVQISYTPPTSRFNFNMSDLQSTILTHGGKLISSTYFIVKA